MEQNMQGETAPQEAAESGTKNKKPIVIAVAAIAAIALVIAGVFVYKAAANGNVKTAYDTAVSGLVEESNALSQATAALVAIAPENEAVRTASAETVALLEEAVSTGAVVPAEAELDVSVLVETVSVTGQSGGSQSGETMTISAKLDELQVAPTVEESSQSSDTAQSGQAAVTVDTLDANPEATASAEQTAIIKHLTEKVTVQNTAVRVLATETINGSYTELVATEQAAYDAARKAFDEKVTAVKKLIADSKNKVADNKVRETLSTDLEKVAEANPALEGTATPSELREATASLVKSTKALEAPAKAVSDAVAAKKTADDKAAAEKAAAEQAAAEQAAADDNGYADDSYYGDDGGSSSGYTGNGGGGNGGYTGNDGGSGSGSPTSNGGGGGGNSNPAPPSTPNPPPSNGGGDDEWIEFCYDGTGTKVPCNW